MLKNLGNYQLLANDNGNKQIVRTNSPDIKKKSLVTSSSHGKNQEVNASFTPSSSSFGTTGASIHANYIKPVLNDFVNPDDRTSINRIYTDIYYHDTIGGAAVDLLSTLPWSDFTLSGIPDPKYLEIFAKSIDNLYLKTLLPEISIDYLVYGAFIGVLNFDENDRIFSSIMPQENSSCEIIELPVYGNDPLIDITIPKHIINLLQSAKRDKRLEKILNQIPDFFLKASKSGKISINPGNALYIPRRTISTTARGTSYFRRILMLHILEKALLRGTIENAYKRQRGILQIRCGTEEWEPSSEELSSIVQMFISADMDPTGAIVATREGIEPNYLGGAQDFWRYDEIYDFLTNAKLKALSLSESLLSADANYNTLDASLTIFLDQLRMYREMITRKIFFNKIFPVIAVTNDLKKSKQERLETTGKYNNRLIALANNEYEIICDSKNIVPDIFDVNLNEYHIPRINWYKALKPEADRDYMEILTTLAEKGVPITLRQFAAAGGVSLSELLNSLDDDIELRKKVDEYNKKKPKPKGDDDSGIYAALNPKDLLKSNKIKRVGFGNRNFEKIEAKDPDTGKVLSKKGKKILDNKMNKLLAEKLAKRAEKDNAKEKRKRSSKEDSKEDNFKSPFFGITR